MSSTTTRKFLVFGATRNQGSNAVKWLSRQSQSSASRIFAVTRDITSDKSSAVASLPGFEPIQGDATQAKQIFERVAAKLSGGEKINGVFFALYGFDAEEQIASSKVLIDVAVQSQVDHVLFSSGDYLGLRDVDTGLSALEAKKTVEDYLLASSIPQKNIVRTTIFLDTFVRVPGFINTIRMWSSEHRGTGVATADIGRAVAKIFTSSTQFSTEPVVGLAGYEGKPIEWLDAWQEVTGEDLRKKEMTRGGPPLSEERARFLKLLIQEECDTRVEESKATFPWLMDWKTFLQENAPLA
ncbi:hypothetical protein CI109_105869 [Kwoniella shandongensis]|uniref:NmrA-like domain-containing protein n=1 Tax=Kwoniella shandongensis TaxID=1734106 RepID=A0A5M6BY59_9TREE|nr:uncharacterized protein CI109_005696 [Kwoniella shandongensis]KAA5525949.1 hypothetical protein CI109_005696 [Kwoniella shandongensis]